MRPDVQSEDFSVAPAANPGDLPARSFLHTVAQDLLFRFGDELKDIAIIFNNKRPVLFLKKHLGELAGKSFWSPSFFTVGEFFAESSALRVADPYTQFWKTLRLDNTSSRILTRSNTSFLNNFGLLFQRKSS